VKGSPVELRYRALMGCLLAAAAPAAAIGAWPTWRLAGGEGIKGELLAGAVMGALSLANGAVLVRRARAGAAALTMTFLATSLLRVAGCAVLAGLVWQVLRPAAAAFLVWIAAFYLVMLAGEACWIVRALRRDPGSPPAPAQAAR